MGYPPPGRLLRAGHGARRLHARFEPGPRPGQGPTVVLEAALGGSSLGWAFVEPEVRRQAATLCYDRAGLGWSDPAPGARGLEAMTADLEAVLEAEAAPAPYVLVGHSFGALVARDYAARRPERVAGLVLVDPPALGEWARPDGEHAAKLATGIRLARRGEWAARFGVAQAAAWLIRIGAFRMAAGMARAVSGGRLRTRSDFNFTPAAKLPPERKPVMRWLWTRPQFYHALAQQMEALPEACRRVAELPAPTGMPVTVLSAADTPAAQLDEHARLAAAAGGTHRRSAHSGHWIPLEDPELVVGAVREMLASFAML